MLHELLMLALYVIGGFAALGIVLYLLMALLAVPGWVIEQDRKDRKSSAVKRR